MGLMTDTVRALEAEKELSETIESVRAEKAEQIVTIQNTYANNIKVIQEAGSHEITLELYNTTSGKKIASDVINLDSEHIMTKARLDLENKKLIFTFSDEHEVECDVTKLLEQILSEETRAKEAEAKLQTNIDNAKVYAEDLIKDLDVAKVELKPSETIKEIEEVDGKINVVTQTIEIEQDHVTGLLSRLTTDEDNILEIKAKIPDEATSENKLVDKAYVDENDVTDEQRQILIDEVSKKINLIVLSQETVTQMGLTVTNNEDGTFTLNGTPEGNVFLTLGTIQLTAGNTYKLIGVPEGQEAKILSIRKQGDAGTIYCFSDATYEAKEDIAGVLYLKGFSGVTYNNVVLKPMISTDLNITYDTFKKHYGEIIHEVELEDALKTKCDKTYYIELDGTSGTLTEEQKEILISGEPTNNFINKSNMIFKCVFYKEKSRAVYAIAGEFKNHVITITLDGGENDGKWELTTYEVLPYSITLSGEEGTLTSEQRKTLLTGSPTNNFINKDNMLFKCVFYNEGVKAVFSIAGESKVHVIEVTLDGGENDGKWELTTYELQPKLTAGDNIKIENNVISAIGDGSEPAAYLKSADVSTTNTLKLKNKDNTETTFTVDLSSKQDKLTENSDITVKTVDVGGVKLDAQTLTDLSGQVETNTADIALLSTDKQDKITSDNKLDYSLIANTPDIPAKVSQLDNDLNFTSNTGTVTSVGVLMNGASKGVITSSGNIDLGTVITEHQDISGKLDKSLSTIQITAPTEAIEDGGIHIVVLDAEPTTKYDGYIYMIKG